MQRTLGLAPIVQADFPICPFCQKAFGRACTIALADGQSWTVCQPCFRLVMILERMAAVGILRRSE